MDCQTTGGLKINILMFFVVVSYWSGSPHYMFILVQFHWEGPHTDSILLFVDYLEHPEGTEPCYSRLGRDTKPNPSAQAVAV
jgi:hypothetical protein